MKKNLFLLFVVSAALFLLGAVIQLRYGAFTFTWETFLPALLWNGGADPRAVSVLWTLRMPRLLCGILVGMNLAFSGAIFQAITRNELASPYLLGVSQGAGLVVMGCILFFPVLLPVLPLLAMVGGIMAFFLVYAIAWNHGASPVRLILAGVILGSLTGSVQTALHFFARDMQTVQNALAWMTGSLVGVGWEQVRMILPWTCVTVVASLALARHLDILLLGEQGARSLGARVDFLRFLLAFFAVLSAASAVSVAGLVGFVGLIIPHIVRHFTSSRHGPLLAGCLMAGPALMVSADAVARIALNPVQLPVGVVTGVLGGGFFIILMKNRKKSWKAGLRNE